MSDSDNIIPFPGNPKIAPKIIKKQIATIGVQRVIKPPKKKKRKNVECELTEEHLTELNYLIRLWVETSKKAINRRDHIDYGGAKTLLWRYGLDNKINGMDQIEDSEFDQAKAYLNQKIKIAERKIPKHKAFGDSQWRNKTLGAIHARCNNLGVSDETRKAYQLARFGKDSLAHFTDDQLEEMYNYVMIGTPKFTIPRGQAKSLQNERENALRVLIGVLEANAKAKGQYFEPMKLPLSKADMLGLLKQREPALFGLMSEEPFNKFWSKQQVCKLKSGKPLGSGSQ